VNDIDAAPIGLPSRNPGAKVFIGVGDAPVVLFLEFVLEGIGSGITSLPESFNELVAFFVVGELLEGGTLFGSNDVGDVLIQPSSVDAEVVDDVQATLLLLLAWKRTLRGSACVGCPGVAVGVSEVGFDCALPTGGSAAIRKMTKKVDDRQ
jgi:hypothetical protein